MKVLALLVVGAFFVIGMVVGFWIGITYLITREEIKRTHDAI